MRIEPPLPGSADDYLRVWTAVLSGWLGWLEPRIDAFVSRWVEAMRNENDLFYHKLPLWYITPLLIQPSLRRRLSDLALHQLEEELEEAIMNYDLAYMQEGYDWELARQRAATVLQRHGATLPKPDDLAWYEEQTNT